jgi:hypothetical protein
MHLILRILKLDILRVPPIQILTKKGYTLSYWDLLNEFSRRTNIMLLKIVVSHKIKYYAIFSNSIGVQEHKKLLRIWKLDFLRSTMQIPTKKI